MSEGIEALIYEKGLTAPRVTASDIREAIVSEWFFTAGDGVRGESAMGTTPAGSAEPLNRLTFCVMVLRNGFTVVGKSAPASPENFDAEVGRAVAREDALKQIWPLEGYLLRERLWVAEQGKLAPGAGAGIMSQGA